jgi:hypothetical protein
MNADIVFESLMRTRKRASDLHQYVIGEIDLPLGLLISVVIASLILLPTASIVHYGFMRWELNLFSAIVILDGTAVFGIVKFMRTMLVIPDPRFLKS